eukprot:m.209280 g.209280  ORF g.209280 m.209280 type:complete len:493 (-) comp18973_c0_seq4:255-1733(-)
MQFLLKIVICCLVSCCFQTHSLGVAVHVNRNLHNRSISDFQNFPTEALAAEYPNTKLILDTVLARGTETWDRLAEMVDTFGHRMTGSKGLEDSLDWIAERIQSEGIKVLREDVQVPNWKRGQESLMMTHPREANIPVLGLGLSIGTGTTPIEAEIVVVDNWDELSVADVTGKIVVMNAAFTSYGATGPYRRTLATQAAEKGAVAALVRSVTPFSLSTLHTGSSETSTIPSAAITIESSEMFKRMQDRGQRVTLRLSMGATGCTKANGCDSFPSSNIVAELTGTEFPNEVIAIGGHIDSWDVGTGAIDDGGGAFAAWGAIQLLWDLNIKPKRTIRAVFWNAEENSGAGAEEYYRAHADENHLIVLESDGGVWTPYGFTVSESSISEEKFKGLQQIAESQLRRIGAGNLTYGGAGADTQVWCQAGVPCGSQVVLDPFTGKPPAGTPEDSGYFWFHHTDADSMTHFTQRELDLNVASFAVLASALAEHGFEPPQM